MARLLSCCLDPTSHGYTAVNRVLYFLLIFVGYFFSFCFIIKNKNIFYLFGLGKNIYKLKIYILSYFLIEVNRVGVRCIHLAIVCLGGQ